MLVESAVLLLSFAPTPKVDERRASTGPSKTSYSSAGGSTCSDGFVDVLIGPMLVEWKDSGGEGCAAYRSNNWSCDQDAYYDKDGYSAKTACCHCGGGQGGGTKCTDKQGWVDSLGDDCAAYARYNWCPKYEDFGRQEVMPKEACCICGGGTKVFTTRSELLAALFEDPQAFYSYAVPELKGDTQDIENWDVSLIEDFDHLVSVATPARVAVPRPQLPARCDARACATRACAPAGRTPPARPTRSPPRARPPPRSSTTRRSSTPTSPSGTWPRGRTSVPWCAPPGPAAASPQSSAPARPPAPRSLTAARAPAASQFMRAEKFNADLSKWDVAKGTRFGYMVRAARPRGGVTS